MIKNIKKRGESVIEINNNGKKMNALKRMNEVIAANIHAAISQTEKPLIMTDYYYEKMKKETIAAKHRLASIMAQESSLADQLNEAKKKAEELECYAEKAARKGEDSDALILLAELESVQKKITMLGQTYSTAQENTIKMKHIYHEMRDKLDEMTQRRELIKAKSAITNSKMALLKMTDTVSVNSIENTFLEMEEKTDRESKTTDALEILSREENPVKTIMQKYNTVSIEEKLEEMKQSIANE